MEARSLQTVRGSNNVINVIVNSLKSDSAVAFENATVHVSVDEATLSRLERDDNLRCPFAYGSAHQNGRRWPPDHAG
jgi:hypothetical protein